MYSTEEKSHKFHVLSPGYLFTPTVATNTSHVLSLTEDEHTMFISLIIWELCAETQKLAPSLCEVSSEISFETLAEASTNFSANKMV